MFTCASLLLPKTVPIHSLWHEMGVCALLESKCVKEYISGGAPLGPRFSHVGDSQTHLINLGYWLKIEIPGLYLRFPNQQVWALHGLRAP